MIKKMGLMALGLSVVLLSGCGSSDNDVVVNPTPPVVTPDPTAPIEEIVVFTPGLLVGRTYTIIDGDEEETVAFTETEMSFTGNGSTGSVPYSINANGELVVDSPEGRIVATLVSIDIGSGDLTVQMDDGIQTVWVLMS